MFIKRGKKEDLEKFAVDRIAKEIEIFLISHETITMGLAGGTSVEGLYKLFGKKDLDWENIHIFLVDERCVPLESKDSNSQIIKKYFSKKLPKKNLHFYDYIKYSSDDYAFRLRKFGNKFDLIILSSGEEGHIASLFPNHESIKSRKVGYIEVNNAPKPPNKRVSATRKIIEKSEISFLLFFGKEKKKAFENFIDENVSIEQCPAKIVNKIKKSFVLTDNK